MKLIGYLAPGELAYTFALPVFEEAERHYFQSVENGLIQGFEPLEGDTGDLTLIDLELSRAVAAGDHPLYVYLKQGQTVVVGTKTEIDQELLSEIRWLSVPLFSKLEMTIYLQNTTLFKYYSDRVQSKLHKQYPDFNGTITVEGPSPAESTHDIKIASQAPDNKLLAIKLRLPEADAILSALLTGSRPAVRTMVIGLGGNEAMAEDILQDAIAAFLELVDAGKFRSEAKIPTTIFAIARNKAISTLRRNQNSPLAHLSQAEYEAEANTTASPESELILEERVLLIRELVEGLESDAAGCTQLLLARYQDGIQSNAALAKAFGLKNAAVVSARLHSCKRDIMKRIAMDPVLLGKAMDYLNGAHELLPLIEKYADQLATIFAFIKGSLATKELAQVQGQLESDTEFRHLVQTMRGIFSR